MTITKIIFVEENDTCRSPMAAALLRACQLDRPVEVQSRGMVVLYPEPMNQKAEAVMIGNGLDTEGFTSTQFDPEEVFLNTLVLTMEQKQRDKIREMLGPDFPEDQVQTLNEYVGEELEIMNPYGATLPAYGVLFESLNRTIQKLADILNGKAEPGGRTEPQVTEE